MKRGIIILLIFVLLASNVFASNYYYDNLITGNSIVSGIVDFFKDLFGKKTKGSSLDLNANNECVKCIDSGKAYCSIDVNIEGSSVGQCDLKNNDKFGIGITFGEGCSSSGGKLIEVKEQCPGYVAPKVAPTTVNGVCGSSNEKTFSTAPTIDLCSTGINGSVQFYDLWQWYCYGINGGMSAECSASYVNPETKPSDFETCNSCLNNGYHWCSDYATGTGIDTNCIENEDDLCLELGGKLVSSADKCPTTPTICTDSDSGLNYYIKGKTVYGIEKEDSCFNPSENFNYINENYCENGIALVKAYNCSDKGEICQDGACTAGLEKHSDLTKINPIKNKFSHIKTFAMLFREITLSDIYSINPLFDFVIGKTSIQKGQGLDKEFIISYYLDLTLSQFNEYVDTPFLLNYAEEKNEDSERAFLHLSKDITIDRRYLGSYTEIPEEGYRRALIDKFFRIYVKQNQNFYDISIKSYYGKGVSVQGDEYIPLCSSSGDEIYIGNLGKFQEINWNVLKSAGSNFEINLEYWNGNEWKKLDVKEDTTENFIKKGKMAFYPPTDWKKNKVNNDYLYWIKIKCPLSLTEGPLLQTHNYGGDIVFGFIVITDPAISGEYYREDDTRITFWGWDENKDGFVDDAEFSNLVNPQATARFKWQSRLATQYMADTWMFNHQDSFFRDYANYYVNHISQNYNVDSFFLDDSDLRVMDVFSGGGGGSYILEYPGNSQEEYIKNKISLYERLQQNFPDKLITLNAGYIFNKFSDDSPMGTLFEGYITYGNSMYDNPVFLKKVADNFEKACQNNKVIFLKADSQALGKERLTYDISTLANIKTGNTEEKRIYALARYYLISNNCTYFSYQDARDYGRPENYWFDAIKFNVGKPLGDFYFIPSEDAQNLNQNNLIKNSGFEETENNEIKNWKKLEWWSQNFAYNSEILSGSKAVKVYSTGENMETGGIYQSLELKPNSVYSFSARIKTENLESRPIEWITNLGAEVNPGATIYFNIPESQGNVYYNGPGPGTHDWTTISGSFRTGNNVDGSYIALMIYNGKGTAWFDDVSLVEGSLPETAGIFAREFENALVLVRPEQFSEKKVSMQLESEYFPLESDGTFSAPVSSVELDDFDARILVKKEDAMRYIPLNDVAVQSITIPDIEIDKENIALIAIKNKGKTREAVDLNLQYKNYGQDIHNEEIQRINLAPFESKIVEFKFIGKVGGNGIRAKAIIDNDANENDNLLWQGKYVQPTKDAQIYGFIPYEIYSGKEAQFSVQIVNKGKEKLSHLSWSMEVAKPSDNSDDCSLNDWSKRKNCQYELVRQGYVDEIDVSKNYFDGYYNENFKAILNKEPGQYIIRMKLQSEDQIKSNNEYFNIIRIKESGPDLRIYENNYNLAFIKDMSTRIQVMIENVGNEEAENVNVSMYYSSDFCNFENPKGCNFELIETKQSRNLGGLGCVNCPLNYNNLEFEFTPQKSGMFTLAFVVNSSKDINLENNILKMYWDAIAAGPDVNVAFSGYNQEYFVGEAGEIKLRVNNYGNRIAQQVNLSVYDINEDKSEERLIYSENLGNLDYRPDACSLNLKEGDEFILKDFNGERKIKVAVIPTEITSVNTYNRVELRSDFGSYSVLLNADGTKKFNLLGIPYKIKAFTGNANSGDNFIRLDLCEELQELELDDNNPKETITVNNEEYEIELTDSYIGGDHRVYSNIAVTKNSESDSLYVSQSQGIVLINGVGIEVLESNSPAAFAGAVGKVKIKVYAPKGEILNSKDVIVPWTPENKGYTKIVANVSVNERLRENEDQNIENNIDEIYTNVKVDGADVALEYYMVKYPIKNQANHIQISVMNYGNKNIQNVILNISDNGKTLETYTFDNLESGMNLGHDYNWIPEEIGLHNLKIELIADDVDKENNVVEKEVRIYDFIEGKINIFDKENNRVFRDIYFPDWRGYTEARDDGIYAEYPNLSNGERFDMDVRYGENRVRAQMLFDSSFKQEMNLISEFYNKTNDSGEYYAVFVNKFEDTSDIKVKEVSLDVPINYFSEWGLNLESVDEREIKFVYCTDFNFSEDKCNVEWVDFDNFYLDAYDSTRWFSDGNVETLTMIYAWTSGIGMKIEAIALKFNPNEDQIENEEIEKIPIETPVTVPINEPSQGSSDGSSGSGGGSIATGMSIKRISAEKTFLNNVFYSLISGNAVKESECVPNWGNCQFGPCKNHFQKLVCVDLNNCMSESGQPRETKSCFQEGECVDRDEDGYGLGPDCIDFDVDDTNLLITIDIPAKTPPKNYNYLFILAGIFIILIVGIVIWIICSKKTE